MNPLLGAANSLSKSESQRHPRQDKPTIVPRLHHSFLRENDLLELSVRWVSTYSLGFKKSEQVWTEGRQISRISSADLIAGRVCQTVPYFHRDHTLSTSAVGLQLQGNGEILRTKVDWIAIKARLGHRPLGRKCFCLLQHCLHGGVLKVWRISVLT